ncbi:hypothetical protein [Nitrosomonas supralitoralis]|uniref:Uncharacterized protein n=1 Tax=Nitrosomonas supralitoralis TaxID=2116706 RepID=A0A2P7NW46_9PROT|nr:hypothetical protein [Nitrosomonas supralitoralis]PSJ17700.1 hypothetical protein C7H79_06740 [Nitrosomonas supralitoralis]
MQKQIAAFIIFMLASLPGYAQQPNFTPEQMQQLMQQAQQMEECMSGIDEKAMEALGKKSQAMEAEIKSLCQANKRSQAQSTAIQFGLSMSQDENIRIAKECGEMAMGMLPKMDYPTSEKDLKGRHICDSY